MLEREPKATKMHKKPHSACGITKAASYPVVSTPPVLNASALRYLPPSSALP